VTITLGFFGVNNGVCTTPDAVAEVGVLAEELGYDSLWIGEHAVLPRPWAQPSPLQPDHPILDPLVTLAFLAARTERIRLATGIVILPQRNPVVLAKELASLDVLSSGRLLFGLGVGYLEPEMRAIGVSMADRGRRADEYIQAMRTLWTDEEPSFAGKHVRIAGVDAYPRPVQQRLPLVIGGHSQAALDRAARHGDGWLGWRLDLDKAGPMIDGLRAAADRAGRDFAELTITIAPAEQLSPEVVAGYAKLGVHRLVAVLTDNFKGGTGTTLDAMVDFVRQNAPERMGLAA
jgi:probable F420-dependent oxidoreductase